MYKILIITCSSTLILFSNASAQPVSKMGPGDYLTSEPIILAGSLAGQKGNVRRHPPSGWGPCQKGYKKIYRRIRAFRLCNDASSSKHGGWLYMRLGVEQVFRKKC